MTNNSPENTGDDSSTFDAIAGSFGEQDRLVTALGVNEDILKGLENGTIHPEDPQITESVTAIDGLMGVCEQSVYCKFYGSNPGFCDRSCDESIWDQI